MPGLTQCGGVDIIYLARLNLLDPFIFKYRYQSSMSLNVGGWGKLHKFNGNVSIGHGFQSRRRTTSSHTALHLLDTNTVPVYKKTKEARFCPFPFYSPLDDNNN